MRHDVFTAGGGAHAEATQGVACRRLLLIAGKLVECRLQCGYGGAGCFWIACGDLEARPVIRDRLPCGRGGWDFGCRLKECRVGWCVVRRECECGYEPWERL